MNWKKQGFVDFSLGELGNSGQNLYVSAKGVLQRIFNYDVNGDGYPDLFFANSQSMGERPPLFLYSEPLTSKEYIELPSNGSFDGIMADLNGDGFEDLIVACQNNGTHTDISSMIYYGSKDGLSEKYRVELPAPDSTGVAAGDFNGDGKMDLAFICGNFLRVFYQNENGMVLCEYKDLFFDVVSICAADINEDGFCDLYVKRADGVCGLLWGSAEGLSCDTAAWMGGGAQEDKHAEPSTTPGRRAAYRGWRVNVVWLDGQQYLFRMEAEDVVLDRYKEGEGLSRAFTIHCPGAVGISAGDLDGDGYEDIAVAVCRDKNEVEQSMVFWGGNDGFSQNNTTCFDTMSAQSLQATDLSGNGEMSLIVCQGGISKSYSTESFVLRFDSCRIPFRIASLDSGDAMRIVAGKTSSARYKQIIVINHETGSVRGDENVYIYLGGPEGYDPGRRLELPGWAAVEGVVFDFDDNGYPDILVSNCAENAPHMDPGSFLYTGGPDGFHKDRRIVIPTIRSHGAAIGDFRKCGYLDIATGGFRNRELRIFRGGPNGYDLNNPDKIVFGPDPENYEPPVPRSEAELTSVFTQDANDLYSEFGEVRFLLTADFNKDGWLDLFVSQISGSSCFILWGGPDGFCTSRMTKLATDGIASANAADLDGDGYIDLILGGHMAKGKKAIYESYVTVYWGGPDGFQEHRKMQLPANCANSTSIGDYNGDGNLDIYATAYNSGRNRDILSYVYYGSKGGNYSIKNYGMLFNHSGCGCVSGDFNGDGYTDLAIACHKGYGDHNSNSYIFWGGPDGLNDLRKTVLPTVGPHGMYPVDAGNIMDRSDNEYYYSECFKVPEGQTAKTVTWEAAIPKSTWVKMQMRHADTQEEILTKEWQGTIEQSMIEKDDDLTVLGYRGGYLQYRLILGAKCSCGTPRVTSVTVEFA